MYKHLFFFLSLSMAIGCRNASSPSAEESVLLRLVENSDDELDFGNDSTQSPECVTILRYVGNVVDSNNGVKLRLISKEYEFGANCTFQIKLLLFDKDYKFLGGYYHLDAAPRQLVMENSGEQSLLVRYESNKDSLIRGFSHAIPVKVLSSEFVKAAPK